MYKYFTAVFMSTTFILMGITFAVSAQHSQAPTAASPVDTTDETPPGEPCVGENLLANPSFEGQYTSYELSGYDDWRIDDCNYLSCGRAQMASDWHPYWRTDERSEVWLNIMPEYKPSLPHETPPRVQEGEKAQHYFSFWSTHEAGMYQQVTAVPGGKYCASIWGHAWSDRTSDDYYSGDPDDDGDLYQRIGIDPTGGTDWQSPNIIWGEMRQQYDEYGVFLAEATAESDTITIFTWSKAWIPVKHNDVYWDDAQLTLTQYGKVLNSTNRALAAVDHPQTITQTIQIKVAGGVEWHASLAPNGNITPTLAQTTGSESTDLAVTLNTIGLSEGYYESTVLITFDPEMPNAPVAIPIGVLIVPEIQNVYLPMIIR